MGNIVCVFAHPDDEAFGPGATIYKLAQKNTLRLLCVTSGDADKRFTNHNINKLGKIREKELLASCKILGVKSVDFLGFKDGSLCNNNYHPVAEKIKVYLDKYKPDTILTFDKSGVSGHLDHIAVSMICSFLFERLDYIKKIMYYCEDYRLKKLIKNYFVYFPEGYKKSQVDLVVNTMPYLKTKIQAMKAHVSQIDDVKWILGSFKDFLLGEYFIVKTKPN